LVARVSARTICSLAPLKKISNQSENTTMRRVTRAA
jgi:hypothetical protein